ncbi:MAG: hypothetical protein HN867_13085 [Deltaproteobacteria bacterium]|nr:hypothetical protein [Deltaproteobacteria bacterium]
MSNDAALVVALHDPHQSYAYGYRNFCEEGGKNGSLRFLINLAMTLMVEISSLRGGSSPTWQSTAQRADING